MARLAGVVTSATYAWAVEMFPPLTPSMTRATYSIASPVDRWAKCRSVASPSSVYPAALPSWEKTRTGRRPNRSLSRPRTGAAMNWQNE